MYNILLCDDEDDIVYALKIYLKDPNFSFYEAKNGKEAIETVKGNRIDLILLDIMMPEMDGIEAMKAIRQYSNVPVILLTAKSENIDKIAGLEEGADDYITKPFDPLEVRARVNAQLRRYTRLGGNTALGETLLVGGLELDDREKEVRLNGEPISFTNTEYEILKLLMNNKGKCFSPAEIYSHIWKENAIGSERTIAVHIRHIREKIEIDPANPRYLTAVWGQGYKINSSEVKGDRL